MSGQEIIVRLKTLSESNRGISQRISQLAKLSSPDQSQSQSSLDDTTARTELSTEIHQELKELQEEFELIKQEAEDLTAASHWSSGATRGSAEKAKERVTVATLIERLGEDLKL
jgi:protein transport protein SEC20